MHRLLTRSVALPVDASAVFRTLYANAPHAFWLDGSDDSGWSYLGSARTARTEWPSGIFEELTRRFGTMRLDAADAPAGMAFRLGWVGWFGYELWQETASRATARMPHGSAFLFAERMIAIDHASGGAWLVALDAPGAGAWLDSTERALSALHPSDFAQTTGASSATANASVVWRHDDEDYVRLIACCLRAIERGDVYQLCLTNSATVAGSFDPLDVYLRLRATSPTHHGGFVRIGDTALLSASPERFLSASPGGVLETRPIKGTRRRGATVGEDAALAEELRSSGKERAENLMIVDLMRNDLSRVARLGSVRVPALLEVESYPQVHQLVSTVRAALADGLTGVDAVRALFPAGSMTGAPKIRAIEILRDLERGPRGVYSGAFGYLGLDGGIDLAMVIRSILVTPNEATVGAGGGITALSDAGEELAEMHLKAAPLLAALGVRSVERR